MTVLALDLGTKTGWALNSSESVPLFKPKCMEGRYFKCAPSVVSGTMDFSNKRFEGGGMRYLRFNKWLDEMADTIHIDEIYFEEVRRHLGTDAAHAYGGFLGILTSWCERNCVPYKGVPVQTIKKYITGKGNASKQMVIEALHNRGYKVIDHNEADALALLLYKGKE